ncbi:TPA: hypothetical protein HA278_04840, partial [Candidatus Woesearchaeota archaeon]|nr:hypothetical protein [Candidatus Woesearchaeota archaeon]
MKKLITILLMAVFVLSIVPAVTAFGIDPPHVVEPLNVPEEDNQNQGGVIPQNPGVEPFPVVEDEDEPQRDIEDPREELRPLPVVEDDNEQEPRPLFIPRVLLPVIPPQGDENPVDSDGDGVVDEEDNCP